MNSIQTNLTVDNFPKRHVLALTDLKSDKPQSESWRQKVDSIYEMMEPKKGSLCALLGPRGTGKTQLATLCAYRLNKEHERTVKYCTVMDFTVEVKSTFGRRDGPGQDEVIREYTVPSFLVIDEFEKRGETDWENNLLFYLLDRRYRSMKDTLLISNATRSEFEALVGDSIASRMNETGGIIFCEWETFR